MGKASQSANNKTTGHVVSSSFSSMCNNSQWSEHLASGDITSGRRGSMSIFGRPSTPPVSSATTRRHTQTQ